MQVKGRALLFQNRALVLKRKEKGQAPSQRRRRNVFLVTARRQRKSCSTGARKRENAKIALFFFVLVGRRRAEAGISLHRTPNCRGKRRVSTSITSGMSQREGQVNRRKRTFPSGWTLTRRKEWQVVPSEVGIGKVEGDVHL